MKTKATKTLHCERCGCAVSTCSEDATKVVCGKCSIGAVSVREDDLGDHWKEHMVQHHEGPETISGHPVKLPQAMQLINKKLAVRYRAEILKTMRPGYDILRVTDRFGKLVFEHDNTNSMHLKATNRRVSEWLKGELGTAN